jgi:acetyl esterase/lipase
MWKPVCFSLAFIAAACGSEPVDAPVALPDAPLSDTTEAPERLAVLSWGDLLSQEKPTPSVEIRIGEGETDIVDLWLPETPGPHPVVLMVHGGCWQKDIADRTLMNYGAEDLRQRGMAVWNIEYRGVDENGGGYPGTYLDVANAADALRDHAADYDLDLTRVTGTGHSAGGHLVTWLSTRANLGKDSPLYMANPIEMVGVINVGGLADLELSTRVTERSCMGDVLDALTGDVNEARPDVYSDTSPARLLPMSAQHVSLSGDLDRISPVGLAHAFAAAVNAAGGTGEAVIIRGNNHTDLIAPGTEAFEVQAEILADFLELD